jgi:hypothetical protein
MTKLLLVVWVSVLFISCVKSPLGPVPGVDTTGAGVVITPPAGPSADTPTGPPPRPLLKKITQAGITSTEFVYNKKWQLVKTIMYSPGLNTTINVQTYLYDYEGTLIRTDNIANMSSSMTVPLYDSSFALLYYNADKRVKESRTYRLVKGKTVFASRLIPEYDAQGRTIVAGLYADSTNTTQFNHRNTYEYDSRGNIVKRVYDQFNFNQASSSVSTYEYDDKKNPYWGIWVFPWGGSINNVIKITEGSTTSVIRIKAYNALGYPTLVHESNGFDYEYIYY